MNKIILSSKIGGSLRAISSKSYVHRLMICAYLSNAKTKITGVTFSQDILATLSVIKGLGGKYKCTKNSIIFTGKNEIKTNATLDCFESGSTLRFAIPLVSALGVGATFKGSERLLARPNEKLLECLSKDNINYIDNKLSGCLKGGDYLIDASVSSQYISGLLMALPLLKNDSTLTLNGEIVSSNYIDITLEVLKKANVSIERKDNTYFIKGNQKYKLPKKIRVNGDWSNSAFMLSLGALANNKVTVNGLTLDAQGDKIILDILSAYGAEVNVKGQKVTVKAKDKKGLQVDLTNAPDLAPVVSILCATSRQNATIKGVDRLKIKESDRLEAITKILKKVGVATEYADDTLLIKGKSESELYKATFDGENDHRIVMSEAILCTLTGGEIIGAEAVNKSYPKFFEDLKSIGGKVL